MKYGMGTGMKIALLVAACAAAFLASTVGLSYFCLFDSSRDDTMAACRNMAGLMARAVSSAIDASATTIESDASAQVLMEAAAESDAKYKGADTAGARARILEIDGRWAMSPADHPTVQEYLGNKASLFLASVAKQNPEFAGLVACDAYGALIGASYKPRTFYFGEEDWFKGVAAAAKGGVSLGEAVFEDAARKWYFPAACAIRDGKAGVIGAYRALIEVSAFFKPLEGFGTVTGGRAALIDGRGYMIYYPGIKPFSNKFCEYEELKRLLNDPKGYAAIDTAYMGKGKTYAAIAPVAAAALSGKGVKLYVVVAESGRAIFAPLNGLVANMSALAMVLGLVALAAAVVIFKGVFASPFRKLIDGLKRLGEGRLDSRVDVRTGDEMEALAAAFNEAVEGLGRVTTSMKVLDREKTERTITEHKFEKETVGFLSLMTQLRGLLADITRGIDSARQEAARTNNEKQKRDLEGLEARAGALADGLEKNIFASKLETGTAEFSMDAIDLRDIIKDVIFAFEPKIRGKGLDLRVDVPKAAVPVRADKGKLKLAFEILVRNSLEAAESGYIAIYVTQSRDSVECSVSDTGPAIPKEDMGDIFERFSGFTRSASQDGSWTDPALYILRKVVEKHGGRVAVDIGHDNAVKFTIKLPSLSAATK